MTEDARRSEEEYAQPLLRDLGKLAATVGKSTDKQKDTKETKDTDTGKTKITLE